MKRKIFMFAASLLMSLAMSVNVSAVSELTNSSGSDSNDTTVGKDETQGKQTAYDNQTITTSSYSGDLGVSVYISKVGYVQYSIPQVLIGDANTSKATYLIGVKGEIASNQKIIISAPTSFDLTDGKRTFQATITQPEISFGYQDINEDNFTEVVGSINFGKVPVGSFKGDFNFTFSLTTE